MRQVLGGIQMKNMKKITYRISILLTVIILGCLGLRAVEIKKVINQLDDKLIRAEKQLIEEQLKLEELQREREEMDTLEYIEKVAREKLGLVKQNDIVFKQKTN